MEREELKSIRHERRGGEILKGGLRNGGKRVKKEIKER